MLAPARVLITATLLALAFPAAAGAAGTLSLSGPADALVGAPYTATVSATTDTFAGVHVFDEPGAVSCAATAGEQAGRPGSQRLTPFGGLFVPPPPGNQDVTSYPTAAGPHTLCAYLVEGFDESSAPVATANSGYLARAPSAGISLLVPPTVDLSRDEEPEFTATGTSEGAAQLAVVAHALGSPCAATAGAEQDRPGAQYVAAEFVYPGPFTLNRPFYLPTGSWLVCAYLFNDRAGTPYATASAPVTVSGGSVRDPRDPVDPSDEFDPDAGVPRGRPTYGGAFGSAPVPLSVGRGGAAANGSSGGAALSGDNRKTRLAAFHSDASNLVRSDTNKTTDVFVWHRPRSRSQIYLSRPAGTLERASVGSGGRQANGPSKSPSLDGSITRKPHCVAFESKASNLAAGDRDKTSDVFVRDLARRRTYLVSRGIRPAATSPSIDGSCSRVAFAAGGQVRVAPVRGGRARSMGRGSQPDFSLDGSALVWVRGGNVWIDRAGRRTKVGPGKHPRVSDQEFGIWGVVFDSRRRLSRKDKNSKQDVYTRVVKRSGGPTRTDLISAPGKGSRSFGKPASNGGITAYGANRGIITFVAGQRAGATLFYRNNNTGNIDNLADTFSGGAASIFGVATSARANFVAFTSKQRLSGYDRHRGGDVFFKHLVDGEPY